MNPSRHPTLRVVATIALLAIGFAAGRFFSPAAPSQPMATAVAPSDSSATPPETVASPSLAADSDAADADSQGNSAWARLSALPHSPAADEAAGLALQKLAERDPSRALAFALNEKNRRRRTDWLHAVLRGWAAVAPDAAGAWLATLPSPEREGAEGAVMDGASRHTAAAVALAQRLVQSDPAAARSHANQLLRVLSHSGEFETGVDFAARLPESIRAEMLGTAFQYWAEAQPERAFDVARKLPGGDARKTAIDAAISGWAQGDPSGLAEFALTLTSAEDRTAALQTAIREWVQINPKAASDWIDKFEPKPELDAGAAAVALQPDLLAKQPAIAASWAESITDTKLRSSTLTNVLREWSIKDAAAALNYARNSTELQPADRTALLAELVAH